VHVIFGVLDVCCGEAPSVYARYIGKAYRQGIYARQCRQGSVDKAYRQGSVGKAV